MKGLKNVSIRHLPTEAQTGAMNMALDAVAAETVSSGGPASLRIYNWDPSTLTLGYAQKPETVDWNYCAREGIEVTRRPTGGGAIYHDAVGDISYSIVLPRAALPDDLTKAYQRLCRPIISVFKRLGIEVGFAESEREAIFEHACYLRSLHPAHDLVVFEDAANRKISGNAQHRQRDAVIQHGSLLYSLPADRHLSCFIDPDVTREEFDDRVTAIDEQVDIPRANVIQAIEDTLSDAYRPSAGSWSAEELDRARELVESRFGASDWVRYGDRHEG